MACPRRTCCKRSKVSVRGESIFYMRRAPIERVMLALFLFVKRLQSWQIKDMTLLDSKTVRGLIQDVHFMLQESLRDDDVMIGKLIYCTCSHLLFDC